MENNLGLNFPFLAVFVANLALLWLLPAFLAQRLLRRTTLAEQSRLLLSWLAFVPLFGPIAILGFLISQPK